MEKHSTGRVAEQFPPEGRGDCIRGSRAWLERCCWPRKSVPVFRTSGIGDLLPPEWPFSTRMGSSNSSRPGCPILLLGTAGCTSSASVPTFSLFSSISVGGSTAVGVSRAASEQVLSDQPLASTRQLNREACKGCDILNKRMPHTLKSGLT